MFKSILVPASGAHPDTALFKSALGVARLFGAHMTFLHLKADVPSAVMTSVYGDMSVGAWQGDAVERIEREVAAMEKRALEAVHDFCAAEHIPVSTSTDMTGVTAEWAVHTSPDPGDIGAYARVYDLVVAGRAAGREYTDIDMLESVLLESGRPLLIPAAQAAAIQPDIVAIAWKSTPEAARAVTAAAPFIAKARRVVILSVDESDEEETAGLAIARCLGWRHANVTVVHRKKGDIPTVDALFAAAGEAGAGLLVMGGYSHNRLREVVFGGVTRRVLSAAPLPVLIAH